MRWEEIERCDGFRVVKSPATGNKPALYTAQFHRRPNTPLRYTAEEAKQDGNAVAAQVRLGVQQEEQQANSRKAHKRMLTASPSSSPALHRAQAPRAVPAWNDGDLGSKSSPKGMQPQPSRSAAAAAAAAGGRPVVTASEAAAQIAASTLAQATGGSLTGSLVKLSTCYHGGLPGKHLLLGKLIGNGGFAEVYEGSAVVVDSNGNIQAREAAAVAAVAAGAAVPSDMLRFAVKVYQSSKPGIASSTLADFAARELHALQLLRGRSEAVQLMAEGQLVCMDSGSSSAAAGKLGSPAGSSRAAIAHADGDAPGRAITAAASNGTSSPPQMRSCVVMELAPMTLRGVLQRVGCCHEAIARNVAMQLLKLLLVAHSGHLGYVISHRDLKPDNILMFDEGRVAVADFGVSHITKIAAAAAAAPVCMQTAIGTAYYAAPDLCGPIAAAGSSDGLDGGNGNNLNSLSDSRRGYNASIDVFAVGVIVLEMLVGNLGGVFKHGALTLSQLLQWEQQLQRVVDGEVPLPCGVVVPPAALEFIGCCCGVGRQREEAAARAEPKRLAPAQLLLYSPWLL